MSGITVYDQYIIADMQKLYVLKCAQVFSSLLDRGVSTEEDLDQLLQDSRSEVASLQERLLHFKAKKDGQITDSDTLEVNLKLYYLFVLSFCCIIN